MTPLLSRMSTWASARPGRVVTLLVAVTIGLGALSTQQTTDTELTAFAPDSDLAAALDRVEEDFAGDRATLQVVVDAGDGGNVLSPQGLAAARSVADVVAGADLDVDLQVDSYATPVVDALESEGVDPGTATTADIARVVRAGLPGESTSLLSGDPVAEARSRGGLVVVRFPADLAEPRVRDLSLALAEEVRDGITPAVEGTGIEVSPFNEAVLSDEMQGQSEEEMPRLLGLSLLLIVGILLFQYRRISDVLLGFAGLVVTIVWMFGLAVLLGPDFLGLTGPFTQMSTMIPVLLVGLGIDYAIHLTSRYREEQDHGHHPAVASATAIRTVGGALMLATATTVVGFLTNLASPLPPMADFGVFTAAGVLAAFVVMSLLVPSARNLLDSRARAQRRTQQRAEQRGDSRSQPAGFGAAVARVAVLAERAPAVTLATAAAVTVVATGAATGIGTSFDQDDFIPEDSEVGQLLDRMDELFSGDVSETTYLVVDGDLEEPGVARGLVAAEQAMADVDQVRPAGSEGDAAQLTSPFTLLAGLAAEDPTVAAEATRLGYEPGAGLAPDADVAGLYDLLRAEAPAQAAQVIDESGGSAVMAVATSAGQEGAPELGEALDAAAAPLTEAGASVTVTSEPLVLDDTLDTLTASQTRGIAITLAGALALLVLYFAARERSPALGLITMVPSIAVVAWVLGTMWLLGISFNVMTAMVASLGIGIGVPFGIHITHRFQEDRARHDDLDGAIRSTVTHTGGAMAGSAATTASGFGVLVLSSLAPMQEFGIIVAVTIVFSFLGAVLIQPSCLKVWGTWHARRSRRATGPPPGGDGGSTAGGNGHTVPGEREGAVPAPAGTGPAG